MQTEREEIRLVELTEKWETWGKDYQIQFQKIERAICHRLTSACRADIGHAPWKMFVPWYLCLGWSMASGHGCRVQFPQGFNGIDGNWILLAYQIYLYYQMPEGVLSNIRAACVKSEFVKIVKHTQQPHLSLIAKRWPRKSAFLKPFAINAPPCSSYAGWSSVRFKLRCPKSFLKSALETIPAGLSYNSFCCPRLRNRKRDTWKWESANSCKFIQIQKQVQHHRHPN